MIRQVPTGDSNDEILQALKSQGYLITNVCRFSNYKGTVPTPSSTVALEFTDPAPHKILLNGLVFRPETQRANPPPPDARSAKSSATPQTTADSSKCVLTVASHTKI